MEKLKSVVPYKTAAASQSARPVPKPAQLSASESKELSIVKKSLTAKGAQTLPSGNQFSSFAPKNLRRNLKTHTDESQYAEVQVNRMHGRTARERDRKSGERKNRSTERKTDRSR